MDHYFGFNTPESRKKQRKAALTEIGEKATNFSGMSPRNTALKCAKGNKICPLK